MTPEKRIKQLRNLRDAYMHLPTAVGFWNKSEGEDLIEVYAELVKEVALAKEIILRGWDDHMWNFECMDEDDEKWLLTWADHPSRPVAL